MRRRKRLAQNDACAGPGFDGEAEAGRRFLRLARLTIATGWWASLLAPIAGLLVFWWLPSKSAVTVYALIVGLGMMLRPVVEEARIRREIREIARRQVHEYHAG